MRRFSIILFFIVIICIPVYAQGVASPVHQQVGKYTIVPYVHSQNKTVQNLTYTQGAMNSLSFWDLPLWIQLACAVQALIGLFVIIKITPVILGKLSTLHENKRAKKVLRYVKNNPGITIAQISNKTKISRDTVKYYVYAYISQNKIVLERFGRQSLLFKNPIKYDVYEKKVISHLHDGMSRKLLRMILENPGVTNIEMSKKFELNKSTIHWHIERLLMDKIIICDQQGNFKKYYIEDKAEKIVRENYEKDKNNKK